MLFITRTETFIKAKEHSDDSNSLLSSLMKVPLLLLLALSVIECLFALMTLLFCLNKCFSAVNELWLAIRFKITTRSAFDNIL